MELLSAGYVHAILQNVAYAVPSRAALIQASVALEVSLDNSTWAALANSTTGTQITAPFVRCPSSNASVIIKLY